MDNKNILISGAGIAGLTLAYWLKKFGFNPTIVEISPKLREGGYAIDFWGAGFDVAERMKIVPDLEKVDLNISEVAFVDENNRRKGGMNYKKLKKMMNGRAFTFLRSDLSRVIYNHLDKGIEIIFGDTINKIEQNEGGVNVTFGSGNIRSFNLVAGADGLHSNVRNLVFGDESQFEKYYGYYTASFTIKDGISHGTSFLTYNTPCKQAAVYSTNENKAATFFIFTSPQKISYRRHDIEKEKEILKSQFKNAGWKCAGLLSKIDTAPDFYFDVVSQIQMDFWSKNRVTLVGDACDCPSLLSGQGSTLAIVGAYILAGELKEANGNYKTAFEQYENIFKPFIDRKQKVAQNFAKSLVPKSKFGIWLRNTFTNLMFLPFVSRLFIRQFMDDKLKLKTY
ncbi:MAG TPA: FAD-dependent monooxygenase [Chitinophagaceae bacterium]|jgi:2-polyprenyl-6-methoxyphenol hydroxylase-like FAD-dependent oxidoreductase